MLSNGMASRNHNLFIEHILRGDKNNILFDVVILISKNVIYNTMKSDKNTHRQQVPNDMKNISYIEIYRASLKCRQAFLERNGSLWPIIL